MPTESSKQKIHYLNELREMIQEGKEPKEKVFAIFCQRHGVPMDECKRYYDKLVAEGKVKQK